MSNVDIMYQNKIYDESLRSINYKQRREKGRREKWSLYKSDLKKIEFFKLYFSGFLSFHCRRVTLDLKTEH